VYEEFFGLRERPFDLTPNPRYLLLTARHREALANLRYGLHGRRGVTLLLGEAGTGKTTLVRAALHAEGAAQSMCVYLNNPTLTRAEFYEMLAAGFGFSLDLAASKARLLLELERALVRNRERGLLSALVVDEAQSLPYELLEEIRLLANIETATDKLLPVVLAGQPELADRLNDVSLRQLKQRIALRCELYPLEIRETAAYIAGRIRIAGGDCARIFTSDAVQTICERSGGIPRTISVLCDNALINGYAVQRQPVDREIVLEVCRDFDLPSGRPNRMLGGVDAATAQALKTDLDRRPGATPGTKAPAAHPASDRSLFTNFSAGKRFSLFSKAGH
jgi:type II secretory pathway predicted ATPase ExeA